MWNVFDFVLVVLGIFGLVMSSFAFNANNAAEGSSESRVIRISRVLRTMRFLRIFRLFHARLSADKYVSLELAGHMHRLQTLHYFTRAHLMAQENLMKYFGGPNQVIDTEDEADIARCLLQSQVGVYRALTATVDVQHYMDKDLLEELANASQRKHITESLEKFVESAHNVGAINAHDAESILHPLRHQIAKCLSLIHARTDGLMNKVGSEHLVDMTQIMSDTFHRNSIQAPAENRSSKVSKDPGPDGTTRAIGASVPGGLGAPSNLAGPSSPGRTEGQVLEAPAAENSAAERADGGLSEDADIIKLRGTFFV